MLFHMTTYTGWYPERILFWETSMSVAMIYLYEKPCLYVSTTEANQALEELCPPQLCIMNSCPSAEPDNVTRECAPKLCARVDLENCHRQLPRKSYPHMLINGCLQSFQRAQDWNRKLCFVKERRRCYVGRCCIPGSVTPEYFQWHTCKWGQLVSMPHRVARSQWLCGQVCRNLVRGYLEQSW